MSIEMLCTQIEADDLRIKEIKIYIKSNDDDHEVGFDLDPCEDVTRAYPDEFSYGELTFCDFDFDLDMWRRLGRAIRNSTSLRYFVLERDESEFRHHGHVPTEVAACLAVFFDEIKHNKSLKVMNLLLYDSDELPMIRLDHILLQNEGLNYIELESHEPISRDQSCVIAAGLGGALLKFLDISFCKFANDRSFQRIISTCTGVEELRLKCTHSRQCAAVASLLRDPRTMLKELHIDSLGDYRGNDKMAAVLDIITSLGGNTKLKCLSIYLNITDEELPNHFINLLCNSSSIEGIINSNHALEQLFYDKWSPSLVKECLELNKLTNKTRVIQNKIMNYYFLGDFDSAPFVSMPISILAKVLSLGKEMNKQNTAIFSLLRSIPELCNLTNRRDEQSSNYKTIHVSSCGKRKKVDG
eukprot:scaffold3828_cov35-Cyclotella_meneghiniana.AAC.2